MIEVKNVSFSYEKEPILKDVSLKISKEFIGIFGPNGGGKTTFLKLLMGFLKPQQGEIFLFGTSPKKARGKIGYVPQIARFDRQFPLTVLELVLMGTLSKATSLGTFTKETKEKAKQILERVGLLEKSHSAFGTLSGGQAQRALIARALLSDPELLILDEPTASVDPDAEAQIHRLLLQLKGSMTILMVTHDLQGIIQQVDRLLCIHREIIPMTKEHVCKHFALGLY